MRVRILSTLIAGTLVLAACGSTTDEADTPAAASSNPAPTATEAPPESVVADEAAPTEPSNASATAAPDATDGGDTSDPAPPPAATEAPAATAAPATDPPPPAPPDDGCSADNSPTATDVADGPVPSLEVRAESVANALPDLAVRRINCDGGWVNIKNELPASQPILVWFYAPH